MKRSLTVLIGVILVVGLVGAVVVSFRNRAADPSSSTDVAPGEPTVPASSEPNNEDTPAKLPGAAELAETLKELEAEGRVKQEADEIRLTSTSVLDAGVQQELRHLDPNLDGWDTEAFSDQAMVQLKLLAKKIQAGKPLGEHVTENFTSVELRPPAESENGSNNAATGTKRVFVDRQMQVSRWSRARGNKSDLPKYQQRAGFQRAMDNVLQPWQDASERPRAAFKITRVRADAGSPLTRVQVQIAGKTARGFAQQNSAWLCRWQQDADAPPLLQAIELEDFEEVVSQVDGGTLLSDATSAVLGANEMFESQFHRDIDYWRDRLDWRLGLDVAGPHGLAVGDVNGDGLDDIYVCEPGGLPNRLYLQSPDGTARDVSAISGVDFLEPATSALLIDVDNDGDEDLLFTSGRYLVSCENSGDGTFVLQSVTTMTGVGRSIAAADWDNDGQLDIYICCYINRDVALDDIGLGMPLPYHDANNGPRNYLFSYAGQWKFNDVTANVGLDQNNRRFSFAAAWEDYDDDGDMDLYVANDFGRNNLYRNDGRKFVDVADQAGVEDIASGMSVTWGDFNLDGNMDVYVGNMFSTAGNRVMYQRRFQSATDEPTRNTFRRLARGNSLFQNNGDGTFRDVSEEMGVTMGRWAWGSVFADLNNDGFEDLLVGNGMITSVEDTGDL